MMMQGIRKAGQSLIGKLIIFVMFGFLIFSFAIWGIGDIFQGYGRNSVARVGKAEIGLEQMRTAFQNDIQALTRQQRHDLIAIEGGGRCSAGTRRSRRGSATA